MVDRSGAQLRPLPSDTIAVSLMTAPDCADSPNGGRLPWQGRKGTMQFIHEEKTDDGAGAMTVVAETSAEVLEVSEHFRVHDKSKPADLMALAGALTAGTLTHTSYREKRPWFVCDSALDHEFTTPYMDLLRKVTGYDGQPPDMDLTPFHPRRLCHTHMTDRVGIRHGHITYRVIIAAEEWNNQEASTRADKNAQDYMEEGFGARKQEPEYIQTRNGSMVRNPDYLKRHRARPALGAPWFWKALFSWWRTNHATDEQRAILDGCDRLKTGGDACYDIRFSSGGGNYLVSGQGMYVEDTAGNIEWDGKGRKARFVKWEDFAALSTVPV